MAVQGSDGVRRNLSIARKETESSFNKISSGQRDRKKDAAAFAVADFIDAQAAQVSVSSRNVADAGSLIDTFESTVSQVGDILGRLSELATQSANGTLDDNQRRALSEEFNALKDEVSRQTASTEFNGVKFGDQINIEIGGNSEQLSISSGDPTQLNNQLSSLDISSQSAAQSAINLIGEATNTVSALKGSFGASQARLSSVSSTLDDQGVLLKATSGRIKDIDVAEEVANLTASRIKESTASIIIGSLGNISKDLVLKLLQ